MTNKPTFGAFMTEVLNRADKLSFEKSGRALSEWYEAPSTILKMTGAVLNTGWTPYTALATLLANASYFAFAAALAVFIINPVGLVVIGALAYWGGEKSLKLLYKNKALLQTVKEIGDRYESRYKNCSSDEEKARLANEAAEELFNKSRL